MALLVQRNLLHEHLRLSAQVGLPGANGHGRAQREVVIEACRRKQQGLISTCCSPPKTTCEWHAVSAWAMLGWPYMPPGAGHDVHMARVVSPTPKVPQVSNRPSRHSTLVRKLTMSWSVKFFFAAIPAACGTQQSASADAHDGGQCRTRFIIK